MSKIFIEDTTLVAIGDAIREKTGSSDKLSPLDMPSAIGGIETGGGGLTEWTINDYASTGGYRHPTANDVLSEYINGKSFTLNIGTSGNLGYLFADCWNLIDLSKVVINYGKAGGAPDGMFYDCYNLEQFPTLNLLDGYTKTETDFEKLFSNCKKIRYIDNDLWQKLFSLKDDNAGVAKSYILAQILASCNSLRELPDMTVFDNIITSNTRNNQNLYYSLCQYCYILDRIDYLPVLNTSNSITTNMFSQTFLYNHRVEDIIFATDNGTPYVRNWSNQTIELNSYIGYASNIGNITNANSTITTDKEVKDDATYQALKNDPDWFSLKPEYSRYNHTSAVNTINSLPDCSAGSGNTIKFLGASGSATDGGAINTLTEEEIAVATAKGWTVTLV